MPDEDGYSIVTKLQIRRYETDSQGKKRNYPWFVEIQNGKGIADKNSNGGTYCQKNSYFCENSVKLFLCDRDMFALFCRANSYINVFEQEMAFRKNRIGNFVNLHNLLKKEINRIEEMLIPEEEDELDKAA